ncbi:MAG: hypothetical protein DI538_15285 [Azospira oryzae]|jgi:CheY-like chemotaxis protein|nr:MAG: hypothetical protein DI538_15285 [Azospira oryzae]
MLHCSSILLVEDDHYDREVFKFALNEIINTPTIDVVSNGEEALNWLYGSLVLPELIFMDVTIPLMDGIECLKVIKNDPLMSHIPVIVLTTSEAHREQALQSGAKGCIRKPNTEKAIREAIESVIRTDTKR